MAQEPDHIEPKSTVTIEVWSALGREELDDWLMENEQHIADVISSLMPRTTSMVWAEAMEAE